MTDEEQAMSDIDSLIRYVESRIQNYSYDVRFASNEKKAFFAKTILQSLKHCSANLCYGKEQIRKYIVKQAEPPD